MVIELVPLATMTGTLKRPFVLENTPAGARHIFEVAESRIQGERLNASMVGTAAADWLTVGPDGVGTVDVRGLVETDDGALIFIQYLGRVDATKNGAAPVYTAPRFETGDDRYRWLNLIQAVGKGTLQGRALTYELYEVR